MNKFMPTTASIFIFGDLSMAGLWLGFSYE